MEKIKCLTRKDIRIFFNEWDGIRKSLGYETITDMMYCLWVEDKNSTMHSLEKKIGFGPKPIRRLLKIIGIWEMVNGYERAWLWRHHDRALKAGYKSMTKWIYELKRRKLTMNQIYKITKIDYRTYNKYYARKVS